MKEDLYEHYRFDVVKGQEPLRIDKYLLNRIEGISRNKIQNAALAEAILVNGKPVKAKRSDGALVFRAGTVTYTIQGDRRLKGEDVWMDQDAGTKGPIVGE